jgi:endoglucanase
MFFTRLLSFLLLSLACMAPLAESLRGSAVAVHGALSVDGNRIVDRSGEPVSLAGPSLFWGNKGRDEGAAYSADEYYNAAVVAYVRREWNAPIIRIAMGAETPGGYIHDPEGRWRRITAVADAAIDEGMYFIADWHSHRAEENLEAAIAFFQRLARRYGDTPNIIYEIYNEPLNTTDWATVIKPYAEAVVGAIREIDPDNLIAVGTQSWSQDVDKAADNPLKGFDNLVYSLHFYAGTHGQSLRDKAAYALNKGLPLMVTEWGTVNADGDGGVAREETLRWIDFLRDNQLSHCNWSLHSKAEGASMLSYGSAPDAEWSDENFSASGKLVRGIIRGWHAWDYSARSREPARDREEVLLRPSGLQH